VDDNGRGFCRYTPFSCNIDNEGDRYGFIRDMKGPQDAINHARSKRIWLANARQLIVREGAVEDIDQTRREAMRPDGVIKIRTDMSDVQVIQQSQEILTTNEFEESAKAEIENFGPNPALIGTGVEAKSGRAMAMMQQIGMMELGPFLSNLRQWKLAVYGRVWGTAKRHWTAQRFLRITGDEQIAQFVELNGLGVDEYGMPQRVNALGVVDVDILLDEGPDTETVQGDAFDNLQALAQNGQPVPPQVLLELSNLPGRTKEKIMAMLAPPPDPAAEQMGALKLEEQAAKVEKLRAEAQAAMEGARLDVEKVEIERMKLMQADQQVVLQRDGMERAREPDPMLMALLQSNAQALAMMAQQTEALRFGMETMAAAMTAPRRVIRNPETGLAEMAVPVLAQPMEQVPTDMMRESSMSEADYGT
jgi:hypothetical protein